MSKSWVSLVNNELDCKVMNYGISGDSTSGMLVRFYTQILRERPDVLFVMGGGNDLRAGCPAWAIQNNIQTIIYNCRANGILPVVGLTVPQDLNNLSLEFSRLAIPENMQIETEKYRSWLLKLPSTIGVDIIDFYDVFASQDLKKVYLDGLHPNMDAQEKLAKRFLEGIKKIINI